MISNMYLFLKNVWSGFILTLYRIKGGYTEVNVRGQSIRIAVDNWRTLKRAKTYSVKEPDTLDWLDSFEPNSCYFDLGANIGQYSLYPVKKHGNKIHVYAFEPQSINYYLLNKNIYLNKLENNITSYCVAVSGNSEFSKLYIPKFIPGGNRSQFYDNRLKSMIAKYIHSTFNNGDFYAINIDLNIIGKWEIPYGAQVIQRYSKHTLDMMSWYFHVFKVLFSKL